MNWDLTKMYNGFEDPAFEADMKALSEQTDAANRMIDAIDDGDFCKKLHALVELICDAQDRAGKLSSMIFFSLSADTNCAPAIAQRTRFLKLNNELELMLSRFTARIAQDDRIEACCDADALLSEHKLFFRNAKEAAAHLIDPALEPVVLKMRLSGGQAWVRLRDDPLLAILPPDYDLDGRHSFPVEGFSGEEFLMPSLGFHQDILRVMRGGGAEPVYRSPQVSDNVIISMVEHGLGLSILSELVLRGRQDDVLAVPLDPPAVREIGVAMRSRKEMPLMVRRFLNEARDLIETL